MPDFLYDWSLLWINYLHAHPIVWWSLFTAAILINIGSYAAKRG